MGITGINSLPSANDMAFVAVSNAMLGSNGVPVVGKYNLCQEEASFGQ